jgi:hypothetical protein
MDTTEQAELRSAVRQAVDATSLRSVGRQIGMSAAGLRKFLRGSEAHPSTWTKVRTWYMREFLSGTEGAAESAVVALTALLHHVEPSLRQRTESAIGELLGRLYGEAGLLAPAWLPGLEGALNAYDEAREEGRQHFAMVDLVRGPSFALAEQPFEGEPRAVVEAIATTRGVWHHDTFHPFHRISRIRLPSRHLDRVPADPAELR